MKHPQAYEEALAGHQEAMADIEGHMDMIEDMTVPDLDALGDLIQTGIKDFVAAGLDAALVP